MSKLAGYPNQQKLDRLKSELITAERVRLEQEGLSVLSHQFVREVGTDAVEANSTTSVINATAHAAQRGDVINFTSGALSGLEAKVDEVDTDTITLAEDLSVAPSTSDTFQILRHKYPVVNSAGLITFTSGPLLFTRDGSDQEVTEDTATPANNRPLPVKITGLDGDVVINSSNLNLEVQLDHDSANPDSVQIGDGTEVMLVNASGEAQVSDDTVRTNTGTIAGDTTSIDGKTPALGAALTAASVPVNVASDQTVPVSAASLPLPTGAATEATLSSIDTDTSTIAGDTTSIDGKTPALGAALTAASVPVNIASDQTVPISASSLPLPTGAATEATLSSIDTDTSTIAGDTTSIDGKTPALGAALTASSVPVNIASDQTVPVSAAALPLPSGAATEATLSSIDGNITACDTDNVTISAALPAGTNNIGDVDIASALPAGTNNIGDVDIASALPTGANTIGAVNLNRLDVVDFLDTPLVDATTINGSAGAFVEVVASTAATVQAVQVMDTSGAFMGVYTGPAASEALAFIYGPGSDQTVQVAIPFGTRISLRSMESAAPTGGDIAMNFMG